MFTHALQNCCFDPGHYVNESRVSREFGSAQTTCARHEFWALTPCRTAVFALCHYIRHVNESRLSRELGSAHTSCARHEFWALTPCRTAVFAPCHYIRHVNESRVSREFGSAQTTCARHEFWALTPCRTAVFDPQTLYSSRERKSGFPGFRQRTDNVRVQRILGTLAMPNFSVCPLPLYSSRERKSGFPGLSHLWALKPYIVDMSHSIDSSVIMRGPSLSHSSQFWRGRDESVRRGAGSQWIVAARPLCHLQCPVAF
jgi:uncharacterized membrane protein YhaH (DUF805 family)